MKNTMFPLSSARVNPGVNPSPLRLALGVAVAVLLVSGAPALQAQVSDDFSDLNDTLSPTWTHLSGYVGSSGQTWDASTGVYQLTALNNGLSTLGFIGSYAGPISTGVNVSADIVSFVGPPAGAVFGVAARLNGNNALGGLTGYGYAYEPFSAGGLGQMVLYRINPGVDVTDLGSQTVTLDPSKDYKFVLDVTVSALHGQVFEIGGGIVAEKFAVDAVYASGFSGLFAYSQSPVPPVNVSFDNFVSLVPEPSVVVLLGLGLVGLVTGRRVWQKRG